MILMNMLFLHNVGRYIGDKMIVAVLQARMSSTRLPGKVIKPLLGIPMLFRQIERIKQAQKIDKLILATSTDKSDDLLEKLSQEYDVECFRGSLEDVLDRYYQAVLPYSPEHVVRLTGDCPLTDPFLIDAVIQFHVDGGYDYSGNAIEPTYPDGLDVEVMRFSALYQAWKEANLSTQREHVTLFFSQNRDAFKIGCFRNSVDHSAWRWTVDEELDFKLVETIFNELYPRNPLFSSNDVVAFLQEYPNLNLLNSKYTRNEGLKKSVKNNRGENIV